MPGRAGTKRSIGSAEVSARIQANRMVRDAVGVFGGGGLTNEKAYCSASSPAWRFAPRNIDYNGRFCMASAAAAGLRAFGMDRGLPFPLEDIPGADAILLAGGNPAETMPPIMQYFEAQRRRGGKFIVVDPRASATAKLADPASATHAGNRRARWRTACCTSRSRNGLIDSDFIAARTSGFEPVRQRRCILLAGSRRAHHRRPGAKASSRRPTSWARRPPRWY